MCFDYLGIRDNHEAENPVYFIYICRCVRAAQLGMVIDVIHANVDGELDRVTIAVVRWIYWGILLGSGKTSVASEVGLALYSRNTQ